MKLNTYFMTDWVYTPVQKQAHSVKRDKGMRQIAKLGFAGAVAIYFLAYLFFSLFIFWRLVVANDLNQCSFIGRLGKDVDMRYLANGDAVANFSIAVGEKWKNKSSGEMQENTTWVRLVAFRKLGEICGKYLAKGSQVYVSGKFKERKWQDNNGQDRYSVEIILDNMQMLGGNPQGGHSNNQGNSQAANQASQAAQMPADDDPFDDGIPF